jgi:hypothetical protein
MGHEERFPADKAECRLLVQKEDDRRNQLQRARRAETSRSPVMGRTSQTVNVDTNSN